ncbi:anti-repressor SinI family protein [Ectobacillus sp. sgz5001026]|uniref:anti-repressor SinI family protein n=1 Tax=Ectobacillus sp. sgz5001026 TaxID=3242473 RepID=UPI0036D3E855
MKQQKEALINHVEAKIDEEWANLILEAKQMGLTIHEIRTFFQENVKKDKKQLPLRQ